MRGAVFSSTNHLPRPGGWVGAGAEDPRGVRVDGPAQSALKVRCARGCGGRFRRGVRVGVSVLTWPALHTSCLLHVCRTLASGQVGQVESVRPNPIVHMYVQQFIASCPMCAAALIDPASRTNPHSVSKRRR